ncbi:hypothetical protein B0H13DRAFT_2350161 [Mycena leptocephala]|nr:hypothetical protein B0H13DRAFT_2350161 [Mycena leptocephala]
MSAFDALDLYRCTISSPARPPLPISAPNPSLPLLTHVLVPSFGHLPSSLLDRSTFLVLVNDPSLAFRPRSSPLHTHPYLFPISISRPISSSKIIHTYLLLLPARSSLSSLRPTLPHSSTPFSTGMLSSLRSCMIDSPLLPYSLRCLPSRSIIWSAHTERFLSPAFIPTLPPSPSPLLLHSLPHIRISYSRIHNLLRPQSLKLLCHRPPSSRTPSLRPLIHLSIQIHPSLPRIHPTLSALSSRLLSLRSSSFRLLSSRLVLSFHPLLTSSLLSIRVTHTPS